MGQIFHTDDHDAVVAKYAELVRKNNPDKYKIVTAGEGHAVKVGGVQADIVLKDVAGKKNLLFIEVETMASLTDRQATDRWQPISGAGTPLQLVIPKGTLQRVKRLCKGAGVKATYYEY